MYRYYLIFIISALSACSNFTFVQENLCGNRVVETDEDCDGYSELEGGTCGEPSHPTGPCTYVCEYVDQAKQACPQGWSCGLDDRCRLGVGFLEVPTEAGDFSQGNIRVADLDGDLFADLVGMRDNRVTVRYGDEDATFVDELIVNSPRPQNSFSIADFDLDGVSDLLVPIRNALHIFLGQTDRDLVSVTYQPWVLPGAAAVSLFPIEADQQRPGDEILVITDEGLRIESVEGQRINAPSLPLPPNRRISQLATRLARSDLGTKDGISEFALSFKNSSAVWVYTSTRSPGGKPTLKLLQGVALPRGASVDEGAAFADINGDGFDDLIVSVRSAIGSQNEIVIAYWNQAQNSFSAACSVRISFGAAELSTTNFPLLFADVNGDRRADFVTRLGIAINPLFDTLAVCGEFPQAAPVAYTAGGEPWAEVVKGDFNGDGKIDLGASYRLKREILLLLGNDSGLFNPVDIDLEKGPSRLSTGDFDGDFVDDIAFTYRALGEQEVILGILFGQQAHENISVRTMGEFENVQALYAMSIASSSGNLDGMTDIIVTSTNSATNDSDEELAVAVMFGNAERRLFSPFLLRDPAPEGALTGVDDPQSAMFGNFCEYCDEAGAENCTASADIAAIAWSGLGSENRLGSGTERTEIPYLWVLSGRTAQTPVSKFDFSDGAYRRTRMETPDEFNMESACWTKADLDYDGFEELIAIDNSGRCGALNALDVSTGPSHLLVVDASTTDNRCDGPLNYQLVSVPSSYRNPTHIQSVDLDNDGDSDLVIGFRGYDSSQSALGSGVVVMWNEGGEFVSSNSTALPQSQAMTSVAVLPQKGSLPQIVVTTRALRMSTESQPMSGVFLHTFEPVSRTYELTAKLADGLGPSQLFVEDMNGNGLMDLGWLDVGRLYFLFAKEGQQKP